MPSPSEIEREKQRYLFEREELLRRRVQELERKLYTSLLNEFAVELDVVDGSLSDSASNQNKVNKIQRIIEKWNKTEHLKVLEGFAKDLTRLSDYNRRYFESLGVAQGAKLEALVESTTNKTLKSIGISPSGKLIPNSYLDNFLQDSTIRNEVVRLSSSAIVNKQGFTAFRDALKDIVVTDRTLGQLNKYYTNFAYDAYQQYDRNFASKVAEGLNLNAFIYEGSIIDTTRKFCSQRAGKVFTREEAAEWQNENFVGKNKGYEPLRDLGGYNCRHNARWITNAEALRRRPDLKLQDGKLVPK